jgi:beta-lactam-binding protein with PASTA domain
MVTVPNVEGLAQDAATAAITGAKVTVGTVTQQTSDTVATGKVIS